MMKMKDPKIKKAIIAFLYAVLLATACYLTVEAVKYWTAQQYITQKVSKLVKGSVTDITLPNTYQFYYNYTTEKDALNITVADGQTVTIYINCTNSDQVAKAYSLFNITVIDPSTNTAKAELDCTQNTPAFFSFTGDGMPHTFDYLIEWNATSINYDGHTITLDVWAG